MSVEPSTWRNRRNNWKGRWLQENGRVESSGPSLPTWTHYSTTIRGPISFVRNPETSWEAPTSQVHTKPVTLKPVGKSEILSHHTSPLSQHHIIRRKPPSLTFSWVGDFPEACLRDWFLTCLNLSSNNNKKKTPRWETLRTKTAVYTNMEALAITPPHGSGKRKWINKVLNPKLVLKNIIGPGIQCSDFYRGYWRGFCLLSLKELLVPGILDAWGKFGLVSAHMPEPLLPVQCNSTGKISSLWLISGRGKGRLRYMSKLFP